MLAIADDTGIDPHEKRVRIDTRKWVMGKLRPKKYGENIKMEHSGPDGAPIAVASTVGLAVAAVKELRALRMDAGALPPPDEADALPPPDDASDLL